MVSQKNISKENLRNTYNQIQKKTERLNTKKDHLIFLSRIVTQQEQLDQRNWQQFQYNLVTKDDEFENMDTNPAGNDHRWIFEYRNTTKCDDKYNM